jgi:hypothetical protein
MSSNLVHFSLCYFSALFMFLLIYQLLIMGCKNGVLKLILI